MKMILDIDTGIDDALALAYVLASPEVELIGVTGTFGNVSVEQGVANDLRLLSLFGRTDVPVYRGLPGVAGASAYEVHEDSVFIHGRNGTGEVEIPAAPARAAEEGSAVEFIAESIRIHGDDLVIVVTGSPTNIAAALTRDPGLAERAHVVVMGGALTQMGNVTPFAEANMWADPEAANELFHTGADLTVVGLDVTMRALMTKQDAERWRATGTAAGAFLADIVAYYFDVLARLDPDFAGGCALHDPLAAAVAIDPTLVETFLINLCVETEGPGRARTIGDPSRLFGEPTTKVALAVDAERFVPQFVERVCSLVSNARP